jgi:hypothetical protein
VAEDEIRIPQCDRPDGGPEQKNGGHNVNSMRRFGEHSLVPPII